ncbi:MULTISPECIES: hypothetical protein [Pseudomonas syringae group]|uniref:Uncharacterized protein n=1 Tax=Pseudomonas syringae pv. maculicola str. ES4326 TaxID=629265 RepID=A0A8T8C2M1_PSEYM|nr:MULTISPECIES: hypothetical protein [Pseudomonas syringae group]QHE97952.1 hypothetical protein PMA4326_015985 [Pseudomonas syringae pv. maculicola str. ES4326]UBY98625.1 hypothetical protein LCG56_05720 [Pseudomonas cannabina pv. alisalensis]
MIVLSSFDVVSPCEYSKLFMAANDLHHALVAAVALRYAVTEFSMPVVFEGGHELRVGVQECGLAQQLESRLDGGVMHDLAVFGNDL